MADKVHVELLAANSQLRHVNPNDWVLILDKTKNLNFTLIQQGKQPEVVFVVMETEYPKAELNRMKRSCHPHFEKWMNSLRDHLSGNQPRLSLPLDIRATAFQMRVWNYLQSIPYGRVQSYSEVALGIGQPKAVRAVARACASNKAAILIPCHRVIRGTGELGGYKWGLARKRAVIDCERDHRDIGLGLSESL